MQAKYTQPKTMEETPTPIVPHGFTALNKGDVVQYEDMFPSGERWEKVTSSTVGHFVKNYPYYIRKNK